jgi:SH3-like domain-containing protein
MKKAGTSFLAVVFVALTVLFVAAGPVAAKMVAVKNENVNMRSEPSLQSRVLWKLGKGFPLKVLRRSGNWYRVQDFEGEKGWVHRNVVNRTGHMIVKKQKINIRNRPTTRSRIVAKANYGVVFKTLRQQSGWVKVRHENITGWIKRTLLWGF